MKAWGVTDVGLRRQENQDAYVIAPELADGALCAVVCDGMGGVNGGRLASSLAVEAFVGALSAGLKPDMTAQQLRSLSVECAARANEAVYRRAQEEPLCRGMGTTLVSALVRGGDALICNVGDSRAYLAGQDGVHRITHDHSVVEEMVESGEITPEEARTHPNRNLITRALGPEPAVPCDVFETPVGEGERLLLCSDGLVVTATDGELAEILSACEDGEEALRRLLRHALERGAPDNVTAVLIENR